MLSISQIQEVRIVEAVRAVRGEQVTPAADQVEAQGPPEVQEVPAEDKKFSNNCTYK